MDRVEQGWIGIDAGKGHHQAVLIDRDGQRLLSRRVINHQPDLVALIDTVQDRVVDPVWAIDLAGGSASLVIGLPLQHGQLVVTCRGSRSIGPQPATAAKGNRRQGRRHHRRSGPVAARSARAARAARRHRPPSTAQFLPCRSSRRPHPQHQPAPRSPRQHISCPGTSAGLHQPRPADPHQRLSNPNSDPPAGCRSRRGWLNFSTRSKARSREQGSAP